MPSSSPHATCASPTHRYTTNPDPAAHLQFPGPSFAETPPYHTSIVLPSPPPPLPISLQPSHSHARVFHIPDCLLPTRHLLSSRPSPPCRKDSFPAYWTRYLVSGFTNFHCRCSGQFASAFKNEHHFPAGWGQRCTQLSLVVEPNSIMVPGQARGKLARMNQHLANNTSLQVHGEIRKR